MPALESFSSLQNGVDAKPSYSYDLDMAVLLFSNGSFSKSLIYLEKSMETFKHLKDFDSYFYCYNLTLQALNELGEKDKLKQWNHSVQEFCLAHQVSQSPVILVCSAYYSMYAEKDFEQARMDLNMALKMSFDRHDSCIKSEDRVGQNKARMEIISCLYTYSLYYYEMEDYDNCLQELKNLNILLKDYSDLKEQVEWDHSKTDNVQELQQHHQILTALNKTFPAVERMKLGVKVLSALIEMKHFQNYKQAEKLLWDLYESANKTNNTYLIPMVLLYMSWCYSKLSNKKQALMFFNLAKKNINPERKLLVNYIESFGQKEKLDLAEDDDKYDIIFDLKDHLIVEKEKGCVELKNQFVLMDLLKLFLLNPGVSYSKENIIQKVWKQDYMPEVHDNKIYVTIKRLREMIEINSCKPVYICRNSRGYYFSNSAKVLIKSEETFNEQTY